MIHSREILFLLYTPFKNKSDFEKRVSYIYIYCIENKVIHSELCLFICVLCA